MSDTRGSLALIRAEKALQTEGHGWIQSGQMLPREEQSAADRSKGSTEGDAPRPGSPSFLCTLPESYQLCCAQPPREPSACCLHAKPHPHTVADAGLRVAQGSKHQFTKN